MKKSELTINVLLTGTWKEAVEVFKGEKTYEEVYGQALKENVTALVKFLKEELKKNKSLMEELGLKKGDVLEALGHTMVDNYQGWEWSSESCDIFKNLAGKPGWENLDPKDEGLKIEFQFIVIQKLFLQTLENLENEDEIRQFEKLVEDFLGDEI